MRILTVQNYKDGIIPKKKSFPIVAEEATLAIINSTEIYGGVIIGSGAQKKWRHSSDLNIAIGLERLHPHDFIYKEVVDALKPVFKLAQTLYVPMDIILYERDNALTNDHVIDDNLYRVIRYFEDNRGLIKNPIYPDIFASNALPRSSSADYMAKMIAKLLKYDLYYDWVDPEQQTDMLRDIIQAPINAARAILLSRTNNLDLSHGTTRSELPKIFRSGSHTTVESRWYLAKIIKLADAYDALLATGKRDVKKYEKMLTNIRSFLPGTMKFLKENMNLLAA